MRAGRSITSVTALPLGLFLAACAGRPGDTGTSPRPEQAQSAELEAIYWARLDSARTRFTPADVHFMTGMISHHGQALVMAGMASTHGASESVLTLAARIINAQRDEIATMQQWLRDRGQPAPTVVVTKGRMMIEGGHPMQMPGMLTDEQMGELDRARGVEFDRLFLVSMIQHHRGAVTMVHDLFATDGAGQDEAVFKFASDVQVDQSTEIARMERLLAALPSRGGR